MSLPDLAHLTTESVNPRSRNISALPTSHILQVINNEDATVAGIVRDQLPVIACAVDEMVPRLQKGGRVVYFGAGTSGRLGVVDASECLPTFNSEQFVGLIAGGDAALRYPAEGIEDSLSLGASDLASLSPPLDPLIDTAVGIASSGRTPYVKGALQCAHGMGCLTVCIVCVRQGELAMMSMNGERIVKHVIEVVVGPEVVTGSTRMKAGTATKMVLNMISTGCMIRLGKTYGNYMVDFRVSNAKLRSRAHRFIRLLCPTPTRTPEDIDALLSACSNSVKLAILVARTGWHVDYAKAELDRVEGKLSDLLNTNLPNTLEGQQSKVGNLPLFFLCVDGGGTTTRAVIATMGEHSAQVSTLAVGLAGSSNISALGVDVAVATISSAIQDALSKCPEILIPGAAQFPTFERIWIGCAGIDPLTRLHDAALFRERISKVLSCSALNLRITSDAALLSSFLSQSEGKCPPSLRNNDFDSGGGIVLISGTGSIGLLYSPSHEQIGRVGGLGYILGDEGSAFHLGRAAIRWLFDRAENEDDTIEGASLKQFVLDSLNASNMGELIGCVYSASGVNEDGTVPKAKIASLCRGILDLAFEYGDAIALQLVESEAQALASIVARLVKIQIKYFQLNMKEKVKVKVVCSGGLMHYRAFRKMVENSIASLSISVRRQDAMHMGIEIDGQEMVFVEDPARRCAEELVKEWMWTSQHNLDKIQM